MNITEMVELVRHQITFLLLINKMYYEVKNINDNENKLRRIKQSNQPYVLQ